MAAASYRYPAAYVIVIVHAIHPHVSKLRLRGAYMERNADLRSIYYCLSSNHRLYPFKQPLHVFDIICPHVDTPPYLVAGIWLTGHKDVLGLWCNEKKYAYLG